MRNQFSRSTIETEGYLNSTSEENNQNAGFINAKNNFKKIHDELDSENRQI